MTAAIAVPASMLIFMGTPPISCADPQTQIQFFRDKATWPRRQCNHYVTLAVTRTNSSPRWVSATNLILVNVALRQRMAATTVWLGPLALGRPSRGLFHFLSLADFVAELGDLARRLAWGAWPVAVPFWSFAHDGLPLKQAPPTGR